MKSAMIVPFRDEAERVLGVARDAQQALSQGVVNEAIFVNDHSEDGPWTVLAEYDGITLEHSASDYLGKAQALDVGIRRAETEGCDTSVFVDADMYGVSPETLSKLLIPLEDGAIMSIGYIGIRRHFAGLPAPFNRLGSLSGLRALKMEAWHTLSDGWFEGRSDKNGYNEAVLNGRVKKLKQPIARVALDGVGHVSKFDKAHSIPKALSGYAQTYAHAIRATTWVAFEPADIEMGIPEEGEVRETNADQFIRAAAAHRKLRNVWGGAALVGGALLGGVGLGELPTDLAILGASLSASGVTVGIGNELRRLDYRTRTKLALAHRVK